MLRNIAIFFALALCVFAQSPVPGVDYPSPIPTPFIGYTTGSNAKRCTPGKSPLNFTSSTFYFCSARNTWSAMGTVGGAFTGTTGVFSSTVTTTSPLPSVVGTSMIGSAAKPWFKLYLGTAATNNFVFTPAATAAARVITVADPGGAATLAYTNPTTAQTISNTTVNPATNTGHERVAHAKYSFATDGGAQGVITPSITASIPDNAIITRVVINSTSACTSDGNATVAIGTSAGSSATALIGDTAIASLGADALVIGVPVPQTAATWVKMSAAGNIIFTIGTADLKAGVIEVWVYYTVAAA
jgi:hypothetical protein